MRGEDEDEDEDEGQGQDEDEDEVEDGDEDEDEDEDDGQDEDEGHGWGMQSTHPAVRELMLSIRNLLSREVGSNLSFINTASAAQTGAAGSAARTHLRGCTSTNQPP